ncbi:hypothetical protein B0O80DRAFT_453431 [Mortierella sp. GBAus27b]|nr:hypothetical protein B0O80DRAFT_453431 [Mortierella sp. GBAus27b]
MQDSSYPLPSQPPGVASPTAASAPYEHDVMYGNHSRYPSQGRQVDYPYVQQHPLQDQPRYSRDGLQPTSPMDATMSPSYNYPAEASPAYVARQSSAMAPPHYLQEIRQETQMGSEGAYREVEPWNSGNYGRSTREQEYELYKSAGLFNPDARGGGGGKPYVDNEKDNEKCWPFLRDIADCCPCLCFCCIFCSQGCY